MSLSQLTIQEVKERVDIEDVISDFVPLKRKGNNLWACCPFHDEKTPSFSVAPNKGIYKCFGCGASGDSIKFVMDLEGLSYIESIKYLAKKYGIQITETQDTPEEVEHQHKRDSLMIVTNFANKRFQDNLRNDPSSRGIGYSYLRERGFSPETIDKFELGYASSKGDDIFAFGSQNGHTKELLVESGLVIQKDDRFYDRFRGRVTFPIHNLSGQPIAFGARILTNDKKQPKYLNSPESEIYHKSKVLYGIAQAKNTIRKEDNCYLVEGYTDVISMHQAGIENVVASSGTSLTKEQIKLIKRFSHNITVLYDGDAAGIKASLRGIDLILEQGLNVKIVRFPEGEDPDSYARKSGGFGFKDFLTSQAQDFIKFKISLLNQDAENDPVKKAEMIGDIVQTISQIPDAVKRTLYIKEASTLLEIDENILINEQNKVILNEKHKNLNRQQRQENAVSYQNIELPPLEGIAQPQQTEKLDKIVESLERESLKLLINFGFNKIEEEYHLYNYLLEELTEVEFKTPKFKQILEVFKGYLEKGIVADAKFIINNISDELKPIIIDMLSEKYELSNNWFERHQIYVPSTEDSLRSSVYVTIMRLKLRMISKMVKDSMEELKHIKEPSQLMEQLSVVKELKEAEKHFAKALGIVINS
ncbi:DNA primase [Aureibacter tunicatorum]|uniref:DNA primase n=1 Tax=Aureibacter tunicatorum TaxID=866807 RepID=A0AAE3XPS7_9BACT|nr:DNA primase [Aureibacter tunicatorum]MDR6239089.1 DNA primase [Aureibacter tunicatorum]BDD04985.1 DNA primase [Aureibacter tunicatorum]